MPAFIHDDFLLQSDEARELYHRFAAAEPIFDYHCHLPQRQIAENHAFADLSEIWLGGDHYKWRAMRTNGVPERLCMGNGSPREKHDAWCATVPYTLGNPLYHWSHLELKRYFGLDPIINATTAPEIWQAANARLAGLRVHDFLALSKVAVVCTTDDPAESLADHAKVARLEIATRVYPTYRPDKALGVNDPAAYRTWLEKLGDVARIPVRTFDDLLAAARWLIGQGITTPQRLGLWGVSNGGLTVAAALTQAPQLFGAAVIESALLDMLAYHQLGQGANWIAEYGSPDKLDERNYLASYSPLHNLRHGAHYPATLITTHACDPRVGAAHSLCFAAALQQAQGGDAPTLLRVDPGSGHGDGPEHGSQIAAASDRLTFFADHLGLRP